MSKKYILIEMYSIQNFILKSKKLKDLYNSSAIAKNFFNGTKEILSDILSTYKVQIKDKFENNITKYKLYEIDGLKGSISEEKINKIKEKHYLEVTNNQDMANKLKNDLPIEIVIYDSLDKIDIVNDLEKLFLKMENKKKEFKGNSYDKEKIYNFCSVCEKRKISKEDGCKKEATCDLCNHIRYYDKIKFESTQTYAERDFEDGKYCFIKLDIDNLGVTNAKINDFETKLELSKDVKRFSECFDEDKIECIYSGGDDALLITTPLNLENDIEDIKRHFQKLKNKYNLTYSMSITIAKGKSNMHNILRKLNYNLNSIKSIKGKNKTVISLLDSSESEIKVILDNRYTLEFLKLKKFFNTNNSEINISPDLINQIDNLLNRFEVSYNLEIHSIFNKFISSQIKRLFFRKMSKVDEKIYSKIAKFYNENLSYNYTVEFDKQNYIQGLKLLSLMGKYYEKLKKVENGKN